MCFQKLYMSYEYTAVWISVHYCIISICLFVFAVICLHCDCRWNVWHCWCHMFAVIIFSNLVPVYHTHPCDIIMFLFVKHNHLQKPNIINMFVYGIFNLMNLCPTIFSVCLHSFPFIFSILCSIATYILCLCVCVLMSLLFKLFYAIMCFHSVF